MFKKLIFCLVVISLIFSPISFDFKNLNESQAGSTVVLINTDTSWTKANGPHLLIDNNLVIAQGITLTLEAGTVVKLLRSSLVVNGNLHAEGSAENPVVFTSINDDTHGGDSNGNSVSLSAPGDWGGIGAYEGGQIDFAYTKVYFGGEPEVFQVNNRLNLNVANASDDVYPVLVLMNASANITNSEIAFNKQGINSYNSNLVMNNSRIFSNGAYGLSVYSESNDMVAADNNWWGDNSGPFNEDSNLLGIGDTVVGQATFRPWTIEDETPANQAPLLSYVSEPGYAIDTDSQGVEPNKGRADLSDFLFKIEYADLDNEAPTSLALVIEGPDSCLPFALEQDISANSALHDGNYANGEQFVLSKKFPQGKYKYHFIASDGNAETRWPAFGELEFEVGYSNVAFIPGIQASRLYTPGLLFENQLWEPNRQADVEKLFLDANGNSVRNDVYTRDVIDEIHGFAGNVYKTWLESLDKLVADNVINKKLIMPYDWRHGLDAITNEAIRTETGSYRMVGEIERLARDSQTGKVTLVAHSMGGLVAKRLMQRLEDLGEANLVDQVILVAVPQAGTPEAAIGILHGDGQELAGGLLLSKPTARAFGENMKSAYSLLPSDAYFAKASTPVISFDDSAFLSNWRAEYGSEIRDSDGLTKLLLGGDGRGDPALNDTNAPNVVSMDLLDETTDFHDRVDSWVAPEGVKVVQIAGWGLDTLSGFRYVEKKKVECPNGNYDDMSKCVAVSRMDREPVFSADGDKTVMMSSAVFMEGVEGFYLDLDKYNKFFEFNIDREHKSILEVDSLKQLIKNLVLGNNLELPKYLSRTKPAISNDDSRVRISVHSPVSLDIYDEQGRHSGNIKNPNVNSDLEMMEENIPDSYYRSIGEGQYAGLDSGSKHSLVLQGKDYGTFTLDLTEVNDEGETTVSYTDVPVTPKTRVSLILTDLESREDLQVDLNGDGKTDIILSPIQDSQDPLVYLGVIKQYTQNMTLDKNAKKLLLAEYEIIGKLLIVNKNEAINRINERLALIMLRLVKAEVVKFSKKVVNKSEAFVLSNMVSNLINLVLQ